MQNKSEKDLLLKLIQFVGLELEGNYRPEDVRLSSEKIDILLSVNAIVADKPGGLSLQELQINCPSFVSLYRAVMLRDIRENEPNGPFDEGRNTVRSPSA